MVHRAVLEEEVGTTLLTRTTRSVQVTLAGRSLYARCTVILRESADAFDELAQGVALLRGTLRIAAPFDYGSSVIVPLVTELTRLYPDIGVTLNLSDRAMKDQPAKALLLGSPCPVLVPCGLGVRIRADLLDVMRIASMVRCIQFV